MMEILPPYWTMDDQLPGLDFNRQILEPGTKDLFPDGAVGIYVDGDFWCVAALPLAEFRHVGIREIVARFWPQYVPEATYGPDHGSHEQALHFLRMQCEANLERARLAETELSSAKIELDRLRAGRSDIAPRIRTRLEHANGYFIAQYEHLLVAMAHEAVPKPEAPGICSVCDLYVSDRVHQKNFMSRKSEGHAPTMQWIEELGDDRGSSLE